LQPGAELVTQKACRNCMWMLATWIFCPSRVLRMRRRIWPPGSRRRCTYIGGSRMGLT
jgi:hypothetical protein